jgi:imidazolonepropionase-like amidohydrolase
MTLLRTLSTTIAGAIVAAGAAAQDLGVPAPAQSAPILIRNATIHPVTAPDIQNGFLLLVDGKIRQVGREGEALNLPERVVPETIDGAGQHVYPGLINPITLIGLLEVGAVRATLDYAEVGAVTPEVRAAVAVNPDSTQIPVTRSNGVLTVGVMPEGGTIPGRASVLRLDGWTWEDLAVLDDAGLVVNWPNVRPIRSRWMRQSEEEQSDATRKSLQAIDDAFADAEAYFAARGVDPLEPVSTRWEGIGPTLRGEKPVFIRAQEAEQIRSAVSWALGRNLKPVIVGGRDAALCADLLKKHDVGVIITGVHRLPARDDSRYDEAFTLPLTLEQAGVRWALGASSTGYGNDRNLAYHAATAVAYGLSPDAALRSITKSAADLLGVGDRLGSLEPGKAATLILTTGDPMEISTHVVEAFIDGRRITLSNKQTKLADKYREKYRQLGHTPSIAAD